MYYSSNILFSILIANYNNGKFLLDAIGSVYKQTYSNWEIVLVDDGSTDNSRQIYKELEKDKRIKIYYNSENKGCGYTKRRCTELASGEIFGFLDPDDALTENAIEVMVKAHLEYSGCSLIHSKFLLCNENLENGISYDKARDISFRDNKFFNLGGEITHFSTFKKSFYNRTSGIDPFLKRAVDQDLYLKLYDIGKTLFIDEALYLYRNHDQGISTNENAFNAIYWHWIVIFDTIRRRNINFEKDFFNYWVRKEDYNGLLKQYKDSKFKRKIEIKLKSLYNKNFGKWFR